MNLVDIEEPKFDAMIELSSPAADHLRTKAQEVVAAYIQHSVIFQNDVDSPYSVGPVAIDPNSSEEFKRSLHGKYSGLNPLEVTFARALDRTQRVWARNPVGSGYSLPLLHEGKAYWPDFLVWVDKAVIVIDTKGDHLLVEASASKLFEIDGAEAGKRVLLRLVSEGRVEIINGAVHNRAKTGFTVWAWRNGRLQPTHCDTEKEAVDAVLRID